MLILTRRVGESLIIGDDISITTLSIKGNHVRFGINAPRELSIHRKEIYAKTQQKIETVNSNDQMETEKICKPIA